MTDAPDYIDPVEGWRVWAVVDDGGRTLLRSLFYDVLWEPGVPACASCEHRQFNPHAPVAVESLALELVEYHVPVEILAREVEREVLPLLPAL